MKIKNMVINLSLLFSSIIFILLLAELCFILFDYEPLKPFLDNAVDPGGRHLILKLSKNKDIIYEPVPLAEGKAWGSHVKINSSGFRDKEYSLKKGNHYRIITIGDSITIGNRLALSEIYAKQLEKMFEDKGKPVEVLNMGVGGFNANQAVSFLKEKGLKFSPDVVVYGFCLNDIMDTSPNLDFINKHGFIMNTSSLKLRTLQFLVLYMHKIKSILNLKNELDALQYSPVENKFYLSQIDRNEYAIFKEMHQLKILRRQYRGFPFFLEFYTAWDKIGALRYAFDKLKRMADTNKFEVVIAIIPYFNKTDGRYLCLPAHRIVAYEAQRQGFDVIDMYKKMDGYGLSKLMMDRIHPNAQGHEMIATMLYDYLSLKKNL